MKKIFALFLMMILLAPSLPTAAKTNVQRVSVYKGKTVTVKPSLKKATYSSTDTSVATVNSKGKIKGFSEGECYVIATRKGKSEVFAVSVLGTGAPKVDAKAKMTAYLAGHKVVYGETTLKEIIDMFADSDYTISYYNPYSLDLEYIEHESPSIKIWQEALIPDQPLATIYFSLTSSPYMDGNITVLDIFFNDCAPKDRFCYGLYIPQVSNYNLFNPEEYFSNLDPNNVILNKDDYKGYGFYSKSIEVEANGRVYYFLFDLGSGRFVKYFVQGRYD